MPSLRSRQCVLTAAALLTLLALLLLPVRAALAGGCCGVATIKNLDTGRELVATRGQFVNGYDLNAFTAFTDFRLRTAPPQRSGPVYEVDRDGWDHRRYYPGVAGAPGAVYYEGLYNGSSEYDRQWFAVPPEQDAALRQVLAANSLTAAAAQQQSLLVLAVFTLSALVLVGLYLTLGAYTRRPAIGAIAIG